MWRGCNEEVVWRVVWVGMATMEGSHWSSMKAPIVTHRSMKKNSLASRARNLHKREG